jgi:hypothetical protein
MLFSGKMVCFQIVPKIINCFKDAGKKIVCFAAIASKPSYRIPKLAPIATKTKNFLPLSIIINYHKINFELHGWWLIRPVVQTGPDLTETAKQLPRGNLLDWTTSRSGVWTGQTNSTILLFS